MSNTLFSLVKSPLGDLIVGLAFGKISKSLPVKRVKETDKVIAFWHPKPFWEKHIVIVPKKAIKSLTSISQSDLEYLSEILVVAKEIVKELDWKEYTLLVNGGTRQEVNQIHFHLQTGGQIVK